MACDHPTNLTNTQNKQPRTHAEIAFVGDGPDSYQVWLGGSPALTRVAYTYQEKYVDIKYDIYVCSYMYT